MLLLANDFYKLDISKMSGLFLVDKPEYFTSNQIVQIIKRQFKLKTGHCGTLDPFASGLLIICVGQGTKIARHIISLNKEYSGIIQLGESRDTDDKTGKILCKGSSINITNKLIDQIIEKFTGKIQQKPPTYSAIKINGKRAYKLARNGILLDLKSREVFINNLEFFNIKNNSIEFKVSCSKGTYIRSLARDIGFFIGTYAYLKKLRRTSIGSFKVINSNIINQDFFHKFGKNKFGTIEKKNLISLNKALDFMPFIKIDNKKNENKILNGESLNFIKTLEQRKNFFIKLINNSNKLLAIIDRQLNYINVFK